MRYEEYRPDPALARCIHRYWFLSGSGSGEAGPPQFQPIVPDGRMELIFNLGDRFQRHHRDGSVERQAHCLLAGQITRCVVVEPGRAIDLVGVRFRAAGLAALLPIPVAELRDEILDSSLVAAHFTEDVGDWLHAAADVATRTGVLNRHFLRLRPKASEPDAAVAAAANRMRATRGRARVASLAAELGISRRTLERRFQTEVGIAPKVFARIARFQHAFRLMQDSEPGTWGRIAYRCGYSDQAHFTREFRAFAGASPSRFFTGLTTLAEFFAGDDVDGEVHPRITDTDEETDTDG